MKGQQEGKKVLGEVGVKGLFVQFLFDYSGDKILYVRGQQVQPPQNASPKWQALTK